jgi:hypothetical protein
MRTAAIGAAIFAAGFVARDVVSVPVVEAQGPGKVFELRTYTSPEGKLPNLQARFRDHTMRIFQKHGMSNVGYWVPQDTPNTLVYIISHTSREQAKQNWAAFQKDPEWQKVAQESQVDGKIVARVESVFMNAADYSPIK